MYFYRSWINVFTQERLLCFDFFRRVCTALGSMIAVNLPDMWYGTGLVVGAFLGFTVAYLRLQWLEKHMDVHVFCNGNLLKRKNEKCPPFKVYDRREAEERKEEN